jgi:hypothetical protein
MNAIITEEAERLTQTHDLVRFTLGTRNTPTALSLTMHPMYEPAAWVDPFGGCI